LESLLREYGYVTIFLVTLLEGETILLIAGILAHQGLLNIEFAILSAFLGSTIGDQIFFHLAKQEGYDFVKKFGYLSAVLPKAEKLVARYGTVIVFGARYIYGLRTALIVMCGLAKMPLLKFTGANIFSAIIWAVSYGFLGYLLAESADALTGLKEIEIFLAVGLAVIAVIFWIIRTSRIKPTVENPKQEK
jgi:membrane protein DedA with SNARE-associated domain